MEGARRRQLEPRSPVPRLPRHPALTPPPEGPVALPVHLRVDSVQGDGGLREGEVRGARIPGTAWQPPRQKAPRLFRSPATDSLVKRYSVWRGLSAVAAGHGMHGSQSLGDPRLGHDGSCIELFLDDGIKTVALPRERIDLPNVLGQQVAPVAGALGICCFLRHNSQTKATRCNSPKSKSTKPRTTSSRRRVGVKNNSCHMCRLNPTKKKDRRCYSS